MDEKVTGVGFRDECDLILGLLQCLKWVVDAKDFQSYINKQHLNPVLVIEDEIKIIDKALDKSSPIWGVNAPLVQW